jgi:hypothetical protein
VLKAEELDREPELKLGPAANAIERREQFAAEAEGRDYEPLTQRGARVHAVRQAKAMFAEMRERLELARDAWAEAREEGQGHVSAGLAALRAVAGRQAKELDQDEIKERLARIAGRDLGHPAQFFLLFFREFRLLSPEFALGAGDGHTFAGAHADEVGLELGEGGEDVEEHLSHRVGRIVDRCAEGKLDALLFQLFRDGPCVGDRAREAVKLRHDKHVACAHGGEGLGETGPVAVRAGQTVICVDAVF